MTQPVTLRRLHRGDLELVRGPVTDQGGELRLLSGSDHGLATSIMVSRVAPGVGPRPHRHPHAEMFVLHEGQGRFEVDGVTIDAEAGDVLIVPPNALHTFVNSGTTMLRHVAIHENRRATTLFEDGTRRD